MQGRMLHAFAHRGAAEYQALHAEKPGVGCEVNLQAPVKRTIVE